ncbi:MAG: hypothetical protein OEU94_12015 [Aquincola sp.]|nr:hypothetical protein [Aquincola sp.]MDH4288605.1 hypothetical protein [Aquincola sp.]MDH5329798.1 hypothetical protein [Aquincola sp.]
MSHAKTLLAACGALYVLSSPGVLAQTTQQAKPAPKAPSIVLPPAAKSAPPKTLSGKGQASGKMLTREELRACLKRLDDINAKTKTLDSQRVTLDRERDELMKEAEALKPLRADVDVKLVAVREWEGRLRAHGAEIEAFNKKIKEADEASRSKREEMAAALEPERDRLSKARPVLAEEEARVVPAYQAAVKTYNERALARDEKVNDWNARNKAVVDSAVTHDDERKSWLAECANRPYREDDEIAIKSGK